MEMEITTRHFQLGDDQKEAIEAAFEKVERFCPRPIESLKLSINHEAGQFESDVVLHLKHHDFRAESVAMEPEIAAAELAESLRKQLDRFKGKTSARQKGAEGGLGKAMPGDLDVFGGDEPAVEGFVLKDLSVEDARTAFASGDLPFLIFRNTANAQLGVIYRKGDGELGHMEADAG